MDEDDSGTLVVDEIVKAVDPKKGNKKVIKFLETCGEPNLQFLVRPKTIRRALRVLDVSGDGVLSSEDLLQFGANRAQDVLRKQLKEQQEKLQRVASRAGVAGFSASNRGEEDRLKLAMNTRISRGLFSSFADGLAVPSASADDATERA